MELFTHVKKTLKDREITQAIKQETTDLCESIDFHMNGLDRAVELE